MLISLDTLGRSSIHKHHMHFSVAIGSILGTQECQRI